MQFAVNYTPKAAALLQAGQISIDLYKCPDWPDLVQEAQEQRPAYVHFPLYAGLNNMPAIDWAKVDGFLATTATRYINLHLAPNTRDFDGMPIDTQDTYWVEQIVARILHDIDIVKARYGAERIILENVPWDPIPQFAIPRPALDPAIVTHIVQESGCGLLLDTAHARIAALYMGMDEIAYVDGLPGEALREVHVTGTMHSEDDGRWHDHFAMTDPDWRLAEHVMARISAGEWRVPEIVALEYGGVGPLFEWRTETEVLAVDAPRLYAMVQDARRTLAQQTPT
ncbi:MAG: hypothetical protein OHK0046_44270 [Anaerolineae bacterium]